MLLAPLSLYPSLSRARSLDLLLSHSLARSLCRSFSRSLVLSFSRLLVLSLALAGSLFRTHARIALVSLRHAYTHTRAYCPCLYTPRVHTRIALVSIRHAYTHTRAYCPCFYTPTPSYCPCLSTSLSVALVSLSCCLSPSSLSLAVCRFLFLDCCILLALAFALARSCGLGACTPCASRFLAPARSLSLSLALSFALARSLSTSLAFSPLHFGSPPSLSLSPPLALSKSLPCNPPPLSPFIFVSHSPFQCRCVCPNPRGRC